MKKLKIILLASLIIYVIFSIKNNIFFCSYDLKTTNIIGKIISYKLNGNYLSATVKGKSKIKVTYYFKTEKELIKFKNNVSLGNVYTFKGKVEEISPNSNFNLFNYQKYLYSKKIYYSMQIDEFSQIKNNTNVFYALKNSIIKKTDKYQSKTYLNLFILGENNTDDVIKESYQNNGISHLFAISGMHITLFTTFLFKILNKIIKNEKIILILISLILLFYLFLTDYSPSVLRASMMYIIIKFKNIYNFKLSSKEIIIIIASMLLFYNPYYIYNIGFVFSFIVSYSLILFEDKINIYNNKIIKIFITSLVSFIVGIPIMINNYHNINLLAPIINVIFVPFVSMILFPLSLVTFIFPFLDSILEYTITIQERLSIFINHYFNITIILRHMPFTMFILYYISIYFILKYLNYKTIIILMIILIFHSNINYFIPYASVSSIDIGQGDSILITFPYNKGNILIDTGGKVVFKTEKWKEQNKFNIAKNTIVPYLKSFGIKKIDYLILSHGDFDHIGEAINLVNNFKVDKVIFNCGEYNDLEKELIKVLDKNKIPYYTCIKELNIDNNKLYFLQTKEYDNENDNSNVIYTEIGGYKFMFMGDASSTTEHEILSRYNLSDIDVLKVGHHGSKTSSSKEFINEINPKYSIISVGKNNRYGHPNKEALDNLQDSKIYRTDQDGSIMFKIKNNRLSIETCAP